MFIALVFLAHIYVDLIVSATNVLVVFLSTINKHFLLFTLTFGTSPAELAEVVAADAISLADAMMVTVGVTDLADAGAAPHADAGMAFPADLAGVVTIGVAPLADARMVTVGVADLVDAGMPFPAEPAGAVTVGVASFADVGMVTVGVTNLADAGAVSLADAGMAFPANPAGVVTVGMAPLTDAGMVTIGVTDVAETAPVDGDGVDIGYYLYDQFVGLVRCNPVGTGYAMPPDDPTDLFGTLLAGQFPWPKEDVTQELVFFLTCIVPFFSKSLTSSVRFRFS